MEVRVLLFGPQAQLAGRREVAVELGGDGPATCGELRAALARVEPKLAAGLPASRFAVNREYAREDQAVEPGDEVALIGMIAGG